MPWIESLARKLPFLKSRSITAVETVGPVGEPHFPEVSFENMVKFGWRKNELIYACISAKALATASPRMYIADKKTGKELPDHPLTILLTKPNPDMSQSEFLSSIIIYTDLAGRATYEIEWEGGLPKWIWPVRPDRLLPVPSAKDPRDHYVFVLPNGKKNRMDKKQVLDIPVFDPLNLLMGYPPAARASRVGDVDNSTTDFVKLFFEKGGVPVGLLKTKQKLFDVDVKRIRAQWQKRYGGSEHWVSPAVLDSDASYEKIGNSFKEMAFETLDARNEARICMVLRVPPIIIAAQVGLARSTFSNYGEARQSWWEDVLIPTFDFFRDKLQNQLLGFYPGAEDRYVIKLDLSEVSALQEDVDGLWTRVMSAVDRGVITVKRAQEILGEDPDPTRDVYRISISVMELPKGKLQSEEEEDRKPEPEPETEPEEEEETEDEDSDDEDSDEDSDGPDQEDAKPQVSTNGKVEGGAGSPSQSHNGTSPNGRGIGTATAQVGNPLEGEQSKVAANSPDDEERRRVEKKFERSMNKYFKELLSDLEEAHS